VLGALKKNQKGVVDHIVLWDQTQPSGFLDEGKAKKSICHSIHRTRLIIKEGIVFLQGMSFSTWKMVQIR